MAEEQEKQIKSKERVRERGEVFTAAREVNAMLDLVKDETENIDSTFLEPACGDGNFLDEVLRRKLAVCKKRYGKSAADYEKMSFLACTTLYGVDIMADNVERCRERLFETWEGSFSGGTSETRNTVPAAPSPRGAATGVRRSDFHGLVAAAVRKVFEKNILLGNALSMKRVDEKGNDLDEPIVFTEWKFPWIDKDIVKRKEYRFDVLLTKSEQKKGSLRGVKGNFRADVQMTLGFIDEPTSYLMGETDEDGSIVLKEYPTIDYWRIGDE